MSEAPMGKQFSGGIHPGTGNKIDVGYALCQGTPEHGFFTETFFKKGVGLSCDVSRLVSKLNMLCE